MGEAVEINRDMIRCRWKFVFRPTWPEPKFRCRFCGRLEANPEALTHCPLGCEDEVELF